MRIWGRAATAAGLAAGYGLLHWLITRKAARFDGAIVLITGGSRGLGFALARAFGSRGAAIAICGRNEDSLLTARETLVAKGIPTIAVNCDVRDPSSVRHAVQEVLHAYGTIDVLVNNAGIITVGPFETMTRSDYEDALNSHFWASYNTIEAVLPVFYEKNAGQIVNISSIGGQISVPHLLPYSVSKFALQAYSEGLRSELAQRNIAVTTVCPGLLRTGSPRNASFKGNHEAEYTWFMISAALPGLSVAASAAARQIVDATARRRPFVEISVPAKLASFAHAVAPHITFGALEIAARMLPQAANENGEAAVKGRNSETRWTASPLTILARKSELEYNQL